MPPFAGLLRRIRSVGLRRLVSGVLFFLVSLAVGRLCETLFSAETLRAALGAQARWLTTVQSLSPFALSRGYLDDVGAVRRGAVIYRGPSSRDVRAASAAMTAQRDSIARRTLCRLAISEAPPPGIPPACAAIGVTDRTSFALQYPALSDRVTVTIPRESSAGTASSSAIPSLLVPLAAIVRTATRLAASDPMSAIAAVVQLLLGVGGVLVLTKSLSATDTAGFDGGLMNLVLLPIACVVMSSVLAWALQAMMVGGLRAFQWVTQLAAAAAGAGGVVGFCWYCATKLGEKGLESAVTGKD